jgi:DHA2 family multidrug resistance protein-like MFS transporter
VSPDLVPDAVEDLADRVAVTGDNVRDQAAGRLTELGSAARHDDPRHWRALVACLLAVVATAIDPPILQATSSGVQGALRLEPERAAQLVGLYYMIQAGTMVAAGVLGDRYGFRKVLLLGLVGMLACAGITAAAGVASVLVVGHVGLTLFTAVVIPLSLASVMRSFGQRVLPVAIALYLTVQLLASLSGPALAQAMFDRFGFGATLAPAMIATVLALVAVRRWLLPAARGERMTGVDALTLVLWSVGMLALVYGTVAFAGGWGENHLLAIILGALGLLGAAARLARSTTRVHLPHVPFRVLGITLFIGAILGLEQSGSLAQLSNFLKGVQGYGDIASGLALAPFALATLVASIATGVALTRRYRGVEIELRAFRRPITLGLILVGISALLLGSLQVDTGYLVIGLALALLGAGASIANVPRTDLLFRSVRADKVGVAAGLNGSSFLLGEALGNISVTVMIAATTAAEWQQRLVDGGLTQEQASTAIESAQRAIFLETAHPFVEPSYLDIASLVPGWAGVFTEGYAAAMVVFAGIAALGVLVAWLGLRKATDARPADALPSPPSAGPTGGVEHDRDSRIDD